MRALVAYASRHGSTEEIAAMVGSVMSGRGLVADVRPAASVTDIGVYRGVVLGSALYAGHWLEPAIEFVDRHAPALAATPVWLFSSGPLGQVTPDHLTQPDDADELFRAILPEEHVIFPGRLDLDLLSLPERMMMRAVGAVEGDHRDWDMVRRWAAELADAMMSAG